jgi:hypothetical protein
MINAVEREINTIRLKINEETEGMSLEQRKERLCKIVDAAEKEFGFVRIANVISSSIDGTYQV